MKQRLVFALSICAALFMASTSVYAANQQMQRSTGSAGMQAQQAHYSQAQLKKFVRAYRDVSQIRKKYSQEIKNSKNSSKVKSVQKRANTAMVKAIRKDGLTVKRYSQIAQSIQKNSQLRKKVTGMMKNG